MGMSKSLFEDEEEEKRLSAEDEGDEELLSFPKTIPKKKPAPPPAPVEPADETLEYKRYHQSLRDLSNTIGKRLTTRGLSKAEVFTSRSNDVVGELYAAMNGKPIIGTFFELHLCLGVMVKWTCTMKAMSGAENATTQKIRDTVLAAVVFGIPLGNAFAGAVQGSVQIDEDGLMRLRYRINSGGTIADEEKLTILDPDNLI